jgi:hypothetical protein
LFDRLDQGIKLRRSRDGLAERQVDDLNAQCLAVRDDVLNRGNDGARGTSPVLVEYLEHHQVRIGRDALKHVARSGAAAANEAGDVRAVAKIVVRSRLRRLMEPVELREIVEALDAAGEVSSRVNAGVERDADARAADRAGRQIGCSTCRCRATGNVPTVCPAARSGRKPVSLFRGKRCGTCARVKDRVRRSTPCFARSLT